MAGIMEMNEIENNKTNIPGITSEGEGTDTKLKSEGYFNQRFGSKELNGKAWIRFINNVKRMVRGSVEYKMFCALCREEFDMSNCKFFGQIDDRDGKVKIEIHHAILGIHEIIEIIVESMIQKGPITTMLVAHEVMKAHFNLSIPVVSLSETAHELVHSGDLQVHMNQTSGDIVEFLRRYKDGFTPELLLKVMDFIENSEDKFDPSILERTEITNRNDLTVDDVIDALMQVIQ